MATQRFPILFTGPNKLMALLGILPSRSDVEVDRSTVRVRLAWAFRGTIDRSSIRSVAPYDRWVWGWGAHGWGGRWLVNGSSHNIVEITIDPAGRGRVLGFPVKLRTLWVSVEDRDGLMAALS